MTTAESATQWISPLILGPLHHLSMAVEDAEAGAQVYEAMGWERFLDLDMGPEMARKVASLLQLERLDGAHAVVLHQPGSYVGMVELFEFKMDAAKGVLSSPLPKGLLVLSYRVADVAASIKQMLDDGFTLIGGPEELRAGGVILAATLEHPNTGVVEIVEYVRR